MLWFSPDSGPSGQHQKLRALESLFCPAEDFDPWLLEWLWDLGILSGHYLPAAFFSWDG